MEKPVYWFRTSDLLLHSPGVEVAAFPLLYPRASFADTDLRDRKCVEDGCELSIFTSHLRKLQSSCTGYMLQPKLTFLIYDIAMANRLVAAINVPVYFNGSPDAARPVHSCHGMPT